MVNYIRTTAKDGLRIPMAALQGSGFQAGEPVKLYAPEHILAVLKRRMTVMELIHAIQGLTRLADMLTVRLGEVCGPCRGCGEGCPLDDGDETDVELPEYLREAAGIPENARLCAYVDEEAKTVTIGAAEHQYDFRDVPGPILELFAAEELCFGKLEEHLIRGDIVYGQ